MFTTSPPRDTVNSRKSTFHYLPDRARFSREKIGKLRGAQVRGGHLARGRGIRRSCALTYRPRDLSRVRAARTRDIRGGEAADRPAAMPPAGACAALARGCATRRCRSAARLPPFAN